MQNGDDKLPTIKVTWDAGKQVALPVFEASEFKTWDMVVGALEMALSHAKFNQGIARMAMVQQAQQQAQQHAAQMAHLLKR